MNLYLFHRFLFKNQSVVPPRVGVGGGGGGVLYYHNAATLIAGTYNASKYIYTSILSKQRAGEVSLVTAR